MTDGSTVASVASVASAADSPEVRPVRRGAHRLDARAARVLERSFAGEAYEPAYAWTSVEVAIASLVAFRVEGQPMRSPSSPARFDPDRIRVAGEPGRQVSALVDRLHAVAAAVASAYKHARVFAPATSDGDPLILAVDVQQQILLLAITGGRASPCRLGNFSGMAPHDVVRVLEERHGTRLTERQVELVVRAGKRAVAMRLRAIGELATVPRRAGERVSEPAGEEQGTEDMARSIPGCDLNGWEEIAEALGRGETTCRNLAKRAEDPLPVYTMRGLSGVGAKRAELLAWAERQIQRVGVPRADVSG